MIFKNKTFVKSSSVSDIFEIIVPDQTTITGTTLYTSTWRIMCVAMRCSLCILDIVSYYTLFHGHWDIYIYIYFAHIDLCVAKCKLYSYVPIHARATKTEHSYVSMEKQVLYQSMSSVRLQFYVYYSCLSRQETTSYKNTNNNKNIAIFFLAINELNYRKFKRDRWNVYIWWIYSI